MEIELEHPIFLVGMPRSGTTVFYETLALHEDLGWFSNYSIKVTRWDFVAAFSRIYDIPVLQAVVPRGEKRQHLQGRRLFNRYLPKPNEGFAKWAAICGEHFLFDCLRDVTATEDERRRTRRSIARVLRYQGKSRFLSKTVGPPRIGYLRSIFPDAYFVHVVRDGRAVVNSLLKEAWWNRRFGDEFWKGALPGGWATEKERSGDSEAVRIAVHWRNMQELTEHEISAVPPDRGLTIHYEDFVKEPGNTLHSVMRFCELSESPRIQSWIESSARYRDMNYKFREEFSVADIAGMEAAMQPWLTKRGYVPLTSADTSVESSTPGR